MTIPIEDATQGQRMTAVEFFTPGAHRVLRAIGILSAIALALVISAYIYRAGYERGMADAQPTLAGPGLYRWLAVGSSRANEGESRLSERPSFASPSAAGQALPGAFVVDTDADEVR